MRESESMHSYYVPAILSRSCMCHQAKQQSLHSLTLHLAGNSHSEQKEKQANGKDRRKKQCFKSDFGMKEVIIGRSIK